MIPYEKQLLPLSRRNARWIGDGRFAPNRYLWLRRQFELSEKPGAAEFLLTAEGRYQCWINGVYLGQGPVPFKKPWQPVDHYDVTEHLKPGPNFLAVLLHDYGIRTHTSSSDTAGIIGLLEWRIGKKTDRLITDEKWTVAEAPEWIQHSRRRSWATGWAEEFDATALATCSEFASSPCFASEFERSAARPVETRKPSEKFFPRPTPLLKEDFLLATRLCSAHRVTAEITRPEKLSLTAWLDTEPQKPLPAKQFEKLRQAFADGRPVRIEPGNSGIALTFDLGEEWSGQIEFEIEAPEGCILEGVGAERLIDERATAAFKGADYAFRYRAREGRQRWRQFTYNGLRWIRLVIRGGKGPVILHRVGLWRRQSGLDYRGYFECSDPLWNQLFHVSLQTLQVSTQEVQVDCPTREQAPYFGDAVWTGLWVAWLTGDDSHLRHLLFLGRTCQNADGLLCGDPLTGLGDGHVLFDYNLIYIWGVRVLYDYCGDAGEVRASLPSVERILKWFLRRMNSNGLVDYDMEESRQAGKGLLFLDHNGLGWHIQNEPGIERRGYNAGLHFLLLNAFETYLHLCKTVKYSPKLKIDAAAVRKLRQTLRKTFWNPQLGLFADALFEGKLSGTLSEQTNALGVLFNLTPPGENRRVLERALRWKEPIARCTPYFMIYLADAMLAEGMRKECIELVEKRWKPMLDAGATTWWECFAGDHLDTWCHPWSALPLPLVFKGILGITPQGTQWKKVEVNPMRGKFRAAEGRLIAPGGEELTVAWKPRQVVNVYSSGSKAGRKIQVLGEG